MNLAAALTIADAAGDDRAKLPVGIDRFDCRLARDASDFRLGYDALFGQFCKTADILPETILRSWFDAGSLSRADAPIVVDYAMVLAFEKSSRAFAGVRDCFVAVDRAAGRAVVLLAHTLVTEPYRRSGLAAVLRAVPVPLARASLRSAGLEGGEILLAAEMDMVTADRDTVVRLLAYGRAGFRLIPPATLPYAQPDFRDVHALGVEAQPLPFLCVVRQVAAAPGRSTSIGQLGEEDRETISRARARAFVAHIDAVHRCHMEGAQLDRIRDHALAALDRVEGDSLPLWTLPRDTKDLQAFRPLLKSVAFRLYPEAWRGPLMEQAEEMAAVAEAWR